MHSSPGKMARRVSRWASLVVPVDPFELARLLGLDVVVGPLHGVDGCLRRDSGGEWYCAISERLPAARQRFTLAHEIGHYLLHRCIREVWALRPGQRGWYERQANRFAAALLMPAGDVHQFAEHLGPNADTLAAAFGVSHHAMEIRLEQLGIAEQPQREDWVDF